ncbi:uncharacterized protein LOC121660451 isoform X2 [Corvus kubaryi]|uniref:uncharacterized protein LOC121660451 isoform X2 n=1 Tax=Corvus kubaryi TaxID=68294 RepID=UPI001C03CA0F|nr:uncharacterized protein LOC121660451 isoform X2 [Corvus kubaryi]
MVRNKAPKVPSKMPGKNSFSHPIFSSFSTPSPSQIPEWLGWGPSIPSYSNSNIFHWPRLLQAPSLDTPRDPGAAAASLGMLCQGGTRPMDKPRRSQWKLRGEQERGSSSCPVSRWLHLRRPRGCCSFLVLPAGIPRSRIHPRVWSRVWDLFPGSGIHPQGPKSFHRVWGPFRGSGVHSPGFGVPSQGLGSLPRIWGPFPGFGVPSQGLGSIPRIWGPFPGFGVPSQGLGSIPRIWGPSLHPLSPRSCSFPGKRQPGPVIPSFPSPSPVPVRLHPGTFPGLKSGSRSRSRSGSRSESHSGSR